MVIATDQWTFLRGDHVAEVLLPHIFYFSVELLRNMQLSIVAALKIFLYSLYKILFMFYFRPLIFDHIIL